MLHDERRVDARRTSCGEATRSFQTQGAHQSTAAPPPLSLSPTPLRYCFRVFRYVSAFFRTTASRAVFTGCLLRVRTSCCSLSHTPQPPRCIKILISLHTYMSPSNISGRIKTRSRSCVCASLVRHACGYAHFGSPLCEYPNFKIMK